MKDELKLMKFVDPKTKSDFKALAKTNPLSPWRNFDNKKRLAMFTTNLFYKGACTPQETSPLESAAGISTLFPSVFRLRIPSLRWPAPSEKKTLSTYQGCRTLRQHWVASKRGWENRGSRGCWLLKKQTWIGNCSGREHPDVCNMNSIYIYISTYLYIHIDPMPGIPGVANPRIISFKRRGQLLLSIFCLEEYLQVFYIFKWS